MAGEDFAKLVGSKTDFCWIVGGWGGEQVGCGCEGRC